MTTRLQLYNAALRLCGEKKISTLSEDRKPRYLLDDIWNDGGVEFCLERGFWTFAERLVRIDYDTEVTPAFGHNRAFTKPTDWVKTSGICSDEFFKTPLTEYEDRSGYWYASIDQIYVKYVSNDTTYGNDLSIWPSQFADYVAAYFASQIVAELTGDEKKKEIVSREVKDKMRDALNHNLSSKPQQFPALGRWVSARTSYSRGDRGNRGSLIG